MLLTEVYLEFSPPSAECSKFDLNGFCIAIDATTIRGESFRVAIVHFGKSIHQETVEDDQMCFGNRRQWIHWDMGVA